MTRLFALLLFATFLTTPATALNWQEDDLDWMGGHAFQYLNADDTGKRALMQVQNRDSDEYGLYHFEFACVLGPDSDVIHISLSVPWRNPYSGAPTQNDMTMRFEYADGAAQTQVVAMVKSPLGDESISWDGRFAVTQTFLNNFAQAQSVTLLDNSGTLIKTFESRGSVLASASLSEYCTGNSNK